MKDKRIVYGSIFAIFLVVLMTVFALYNEGFFTKETYHNELLGFSIELPRGYRLGTEYMALLHETNFTNIRLTSTSTYSPEQAEFIVLTTQDKKQEQETINILRKYPIYSLEGVCDCVVLSTSVIPKTMTDFLNQRDVKDGKLLTGNVISAKNGENYQVYENKLSETKAIGGEVKESISQNKRQKVSLYFPESKDFVIDNRYIDDQPVTVYGLNISRFTSENQKASLDKFIDAIKF